MPVIHRFWAGPTPPTHDYADELAALHPDTVITTWTPDTTPAPWLDLATATAHLIHPAHQRRHQANVVRLHALHTHGGWWADHDLEPHQPFTTLPYPATAMHRGGLRCNSWLAYPAGHPDLAAALDRIEAAAGHTGPPRPSTQVSGERLLDTATAPGLLLWRDVDGTINPGATRWATHHATTASQRTHLRR